MGARALCSAQKMAMGPRASIPTANSLQARVQATTVSTCPCGGDRIACPVPHALPDPSSHNFSASGGLTRPQQWFQPPTTSVGPVPSPRDYSSRSQSVTVGTQPVSGLSSEARTKRNRLFLIQAGSHVVHCGAVLAVAGASRGAGELVLHLEVPRRS